MNLNSILSSNNIMIVTMENVLDNSIINFEIRLKLILKIVVSFKPISASLVKNHYFLISMISVLCFDCPTTDKVEAFKI